MRTIACVVLPLVGQAMVDEPHSMLQVRQNEYCRGGRCSPLSCDEYECPAEDGYEAIPGSPMCNDRVGKNACLKQCCQEMTTTTTTCEDEATTTTTTCEDEATTTTTTMGPTKPPADDVDVEGPDDGTVVGDVCTHGTILQFNSKSLVKNNLGGLGPKKGKDPTIQWNNVAKLGKKSVNLVAVPTNNKYTDANKDFVWLGYYQAEKFIAENNGINEDVGCIGSLAKGDFDVTFKFQFEDGTPATIPYLPLVFYDIDGGHETTATNDAINAVLSKNTAITKCKDTKSKSHQSMGKEFEFCHSGSKDEVPTKNMDWDHLTDSQKAASVTYVFKDKSEFSIRYSLGYEHRIFLFKGSNTMVCKEQSGKRPAPKKPAPKKPAPKMPAPKVKVPAPKKPAPKMPNWWGEDDD